MSEDNDVEILNIYDKLKVKYDLVLTNTFDLDEGFTIDCPILVGKAHGQIIEMYKNKMFIISVMNDKQTMGIHWHPFDELSAIDDVIEFMEGKADYEMIPFNQA